MVASVLRSCMIAFPHLGQVYQKVGALDHFGNGCAFEEQGARWAGLHTFATTGTRRRVAPGFVQISHHLGVDAASHNIPCMRAFYLIADTNTARTQDAAIGIKG